MALGRLYAGEITAIAPTGPLCLGGNCQGGLVMREVGLALMRQGREVALTILMEQGRFLHYPGATLLLFGAGLAAGNLLGGKLADRGVVRALFLSVGALMVVLVAGRWAFGHPAVAMAYALVLGTVAFATVAPMQMRVLQQAGPEGANLASSLNIGAFNLGNAIGAWLGGAVITAGGSLQSIPLVAACVTLCALALAVYVAWLDQRGAVAPAGLAACEAR